MSRRGESAGVAVITDARDARSLDLQRRQRHYIITMSIRTACFAGLIFAPGIWRWLCLAGAVILPWIAVTFVNQADKRGAAAPVAAEESRGAVTGYRADQVIPGQVEPSEPAP